MQRKSKSWRDKLPPEVLEYLDVYGELRPFTQILDGDLTTVTRDIAARSTGKVRQQPELPEDTEMRTLTLDGRGIERLAAIGFNSGEFVVGENLVRAGLAEFLEPALLLADLLDDPKQRAAACFGFALLYKAVGGMVAAMKHAKYGDAPLDAEKAGVVAAMFFEFLAKLGRGKVEVPKGRPNSDLINVVNLIRRHQTEPLTPKELHAVANQAGLYRDDPEAFRVWLHLETKKGRINRSTNGSEISRAVTELEIPLKENGSIDLGAMPSAARSKLLKILKDPVFRESIGLKEPEKAC